MILSRILKKTGFSKKLPHPVFDQKKNRLIFSDFPTALRDFFLMNLVVGLTLIFGGKE